MLRLQMPAAAWAKMSKTTGAATAVDFSGKVVMITGGSSGIGACCVQRFAQAGGSVVVLDRHTPAGVTGQTDSATSKSLFVQGDVTAAADVRRAIDTAVHKFGRVDIGVNCAGIMGPRLPLIEQSDDALEELVAINVRGVFLATKYQLRAMLDCGGGSVVNVASVFSFRPLETFGLYSATKHAVAGLTKAAAVEVASCGIRVNAVAPGPIRTPFIGQLSEAEEKWAIASVPMKRLGQPEDVADVIVWLTSDAARFITGAIIPVDGGINAKMFAG
jgi:NAD(P)-dependent dehydrogenase (short-subunit alcohol dehydrogenase family)